MALPRLRDQWNEKALSQALATKKVNSPDADGVTPLWHAVYFGRADWATRLIAAGASVLLDDVAHIDRAMKTVEAWRGVPDPGHPSPTGIGTLLHVAAARAGSPEMAGMLLAAGVPVDGRDRFGCTPLHLAAAQSNAPLTETLISAGAGIDAIDRAGYAPLDHGAFHHDVLKVLLTRGANPNGGPRTSWGTMNAQAWSIVVNAAYSGQVDVLAALTKAGADLAKHPDALPLAASQRRNDAVQFLIKHGAPVNVTTRWHGELLGPLAMAAWSGSLPTVETLQPHCPTEIHAALAAAIMGSGLDSGTAAPGRAHERRSVIAWLLDHGADPSRGLIAAASVPDPTFASVLLEHGAKTDAVDAAGETALVHAARFASHRVVTALLAHGADPKARGADGRSAYAIAEDVYRKQNVDEARLVMRAIDTAGGAPPPAKTDTVDEPVGPSVGRMVSHPKFGDGEVLAIDGDKLTVAFEGGDKKTLLARFVTVKHS